MKNQFFTLILLLVFFQSFAQITAGRYIIKLAINDKAIHNEGGNRITLQEACANYNVNCQNQIWDIKPIRGLAGLFFIQLVHNRKCISFKQDAKGEINSDIWMEAQKPLANMQTQSFYIANVGNGNFTIQPNKGEKDSDVYFAAKLANMNVNGGDLQFELKNRVLNPTGYNNTTNIYFKFLPVPSTSTVQVIPAANIVKSSPVVVTPKSDNKLDIDFKTGNDNLDPKDFMEGLKVTLKIRNQPDIVKENVNEGKEWPNNSVRRVTFNLPATVACADISHVIISRMPKGGTWNNMTGIVGDNWNLDKVTVTSRFKIDGVMKSGLMSFVSPSGSRFPLYRFIYENRDNDMNTGNTLTIQMNGICQTYGNTPNASNAVTTNAILTCFFGTGGDNLEGGNNNVNVRIKFKSSPRIISLNNINQSEKWNNFTESTKTRTIPTSTNIDINDIKEVEIRHTGGGGIGADNWDVDKVKIIISKDGQNKTLVDKVNAPIHRFTGDSRAKTFFVE